MAEDFLDEYELEDGEWEEGVVYVDEDGNEFTVEFVHEDDDTAQPERKLDEETAVDDTGKAGEENPLGYDAIQNATDTANEIFHTSAKPVREIAETGREMKEAMDDIKSMFDLKDLFKF